MWRSLALLGCLACLSTSRLGAAEPARVIEGQDGRWYREWRETVRKPVSETHYRDQSVTVIRQQQRTAYRPVYRVYQAPITEYRLEPRLVNWWNPLAGARWEQRYVPYTRWESRTEVAQQPVLVSEWVPQQQATRIPVTTRRIEFAEVTRRQLVSGPGGAQGPLADSRLARTPTSTGTHQPRFLPSSPSSGEWRDATTTPVR